MIELDRREKRIVAAGIAALRDRKNSGPTTRPINRFIKLIHDKWEISSTCIAELTKKYAQPTGVGVSDSTVRRIISPEVYGRKPGVTKTGEAAGKRKKDKDRVSQVIDLVASPATLAPTPRPPLISIGTTPEFVLRKDLDAIIEGKVLEILAALEKKPETPRNDHKPDPFEEMFA